MCRFPAILHRGKAHSVPERFPNPLTLLELAGDSRLARLLL